MYKTKNPSAIRSQKDITKALLNLMNEYPYEEISVKQILIDAKLARKTFYRNFKSKDDVLLSLIREKLFCYFQIVNKGDVDVLSTIFSFAVKNRELLMLLERNNLLHVVLQCMNENIGLHKTKYVSKNNPFVRLFDGLDSEYLISLNIGAIWNVITLWIHEGMKDDPEYIKNSISKYLMSLSEENIISWSPKY